MTQIINFTRADLPSLPAFYPPQTAVGPDASSLPDKPALFQNPFLLPSPGPLAPSSDGSSAGDGQSKVTLQTPPPSPSAAKTAPPSTPSRPALPPGMLTSPQKYFPISPSSGKIKWTPRSQREKRVIYVLKNFDTSELYIGKTERELQFRISEHYRLGLKSAIKHSLLSMKSRRLKKPDFHQLLITDHFAVGILFRQSDNPSLDLSQAEKTAIAFKGSYQHGYNRSPGGEGGLRSTFPPDPTQTKITAYLHP
ncbi:MAG: hypothetical protein WC371_00115 [Parachlamydiales bacterium]